ncbi:MAG: hypothetical protein WAN03_16790 [Candidatus Sulfotelmatobacter sp.]
MQMRNALSVVFALILMGMVCLPSARADEWNEKTEFAFNQPVQLPHVVLPAGTYWFVLSNDQSNRHIVRVFSENWSKIYATLIAVPTYRAEATNRTEIRFAERPHNRPEALLKWYYPGQLTGNQFVYSRKHETEFHHDAQQDLVAPVLVTRS